MYRFLALLAFVCISFCLHAQIVSGPMLGQVELRTAKVWVEVLPTVKEVKLVYYKEKGSPRKSIIKRIPSGQEFAPLVFDINALDPGTAYRYELVADGKTTKASGSFTTKELWQHRKPAPDFSFIAGSCTYVNEPVYDRPGKPYGLDSSIFLTMAKEKSAFMLWLGDNWYTREADYFSDWGLWYRAHHDRKLPSLQPLLRAMSHYAIWDDHDYGPDNMGAHYVLKETSRNVFASYWANPSYGMNGQGVYTKFSCSDADFFLCDDRWWRSDDNLRDSIDGTAHHDKRMLGKEQMEWLKNSLRYSRAVFKLVVIGTQVLNTVSKRDKMLDFPVEYTELLQFIKDEKIQGVLFISGDRHHSAIFKQERAGDYTLYDITVSPLTSGFSNPSAEEKADASHVLSVEGKQNYARFSFTGAKGNRKISVAFMGLKGEVLKEWSIGEQALKSAGR